MTGKVSPPVFLERRGYRRRRILDALRLLPFVGVGLLLMPMLWPARADEAGAPVSMSGAILYIFAVWLVLIAASAGLSMALRAFEDRRE